MRHVELGCGLIAIGRQWGTTPRVPSETEAVDFLQSAYDAGIRFFDTAPSYGLSEQRLALFLDTLTSDQRREVQISTKFGEHWDIEQQGVYTDHSLEALKRSFDNSQKLLGQIAVLQLHKTTPQLLLDSDIDQALAYAQNCGVAKLGASVSDAESASIAINDNRLDVIQIPYNEASAQFKQYIETASNNGKELLINRPLQMGNIATHTKSPEDKEEKITNALQLILQKDFNGVILSGTSSTKHLKENISAFNRALEL